jgi:hypothetical protein
VLGTASLAEVRGVTHVAVRAEAETVRPVISQGARKRMRVRVWSVKTRELSTPLSLAPPVDDWIKTGCCTRRETPKGFDPLRLMPESRQALLWWREG